MHLVSLNKSWKIKLVGRSWGVSNILIVVLTFFFGIIFIRFRKVYFMLTITVFLLCIFITHFFVWILILIILAFRATMYNFVIDAASQGFQWNIWSLNWFTLFRIFHLLFFWSKTGGFEWVVGNRGRLVKVQVFGVLLALTSIVFMAPTIWITSLFWSSLEEISSPALWVFMVDNGRLALIDIVVWIVENAIFVYLLRLVTISLAISEMIGHGAVCLRQHPDCMGRLDKCILTGLHLE